jgi:hypothetical protein
VLSSISAGVGRHNRVLLVGHMWIAQLIVRKPVHHSAAKPGYSSFEVDQICFLHRTMLLLERCAGIGVA